MNARTPDPMQARLMEIARAECAARSRRTGIQERPGGLPKIEDRRMVEARWEVRKAAILGEIRKGNRSLSSIRKALHAVGWVNHGVETLMVAGTIRVAERGRNWVRYEVVE